MRPRSILIGLTVACGSVEVGCATIAPVPERLLTADSSYAVGRAAQDFAFPVNKVGLAITEAMTDLKMTSVEPSRDGAAYKIEATTADSRNVLVTLRSQKSHTRVSCRIGRFGDEPLSRALLERAGVRLGTLPAAAIPDQVPSKPGSNPYFSRDAVSNEEMLKDVAEAPYRDRVVP